MNTNLQPPPAPSPSSVYSRCWRGRINVGTVVNSACRRHDVGGLLVSGCLSSLDSSSPPSSISGPKTKLLYFRTTEDNLRKAFEQFGKLTLGMFSLVSLSVSIYFTTKSRMMRYETEEESLKAIQGMHGKHTLEQIRCQFLLFELEDLLPSLSLSNLTKCFVETIRNFFAALFLASIGMLIHMHFLWNHVILVAAMLLVIVIKTDWVQRRNAYRKRSVTTKLRRSPGGAQKPQSRYCRCVFGKVLCRCVSGVALSAAATVKLSTAATPVKLSTVATLVKPSAVTFSFSIQDPPEMETRRRWRIIEDEDSTHQQWRIYNCI
ncbi:hypothetical protein HID58_046936 [Brassica napus]|uniref:RRM domain-containing protein n=1 Tax=Brassica napus TaxID=3708 RepID=A0ABQ8AYV6_BRANA|nr:hypothetical protein HID58_046936 [Brassica napus]